MDDPTLGEGRQDASSNRGSLGHTPGEGRKASVATVTISLFIIAICSAAAFWVQSPYFESIHTSDDLRHLALVGRLYQGDISWPEYLLTPYREHFLPVWRTWYYFTWEKVGVEPRAWHLAITGLHAFSAVCLFVILRRYLHELAAAVIGTFLWAASSFGRMDNTMNWIAASHLTFGVAWLLAASACLTRFHSKHSTMWAIAMGFCVAGSIGSMGAMIVLTPTLLLQYWWLEKNVAAPGSRQWTWLAAWVLPIIIFVLLQPAVAGASWSHTLNKISAETLSGSGKTFLSSYVSALGDLLPIWPMPSSRYHPSSIERIVISAIAGSFIAACFWLWDRLNVRLLGALVLPILLYTALVHLARTDMDHVYASSRYDYLPTLGWCVLIAIIADVALGFLPSPARWPAWIGLIVLAFLATSRQSDRAVVARKNWVEYCSLYRTHFQGYPVVFSELSRKATSNDITVVLPDVQIEFPFSMESSVHLKQDLSTFLDWNFPDGLENVQVVPRKNVTLDDTVEALELLKTIDSPVSESLAGQIRGALAQH